MTCGVAVAVFILRVVTALVWGDAAVDANCRWIYILHLLDLWRGGVGERRGKGKEESVLKPLGRRKVY